MKDIKFNFSNLLSALIVVLIFIYFFVITLVHPTDINNNAGEIKTALIGILATIAAYHWGSSKSSANKDEVISSALKNAQKSE